ncbi:M23 family metallopeptidase [Marinobacterium sp. BA1]|uniref:M23 family metallopeptidase n=1 Tax=Marinobacterium sp. BA1 TaxID=3138931 RepID=UPI0032E5A8BD
MDLQQVVVYSVNNGHLQAEPDPRLRSHATDRLRVAAATSMLSIALAGGLAVNPAEANPRFSPEAYAAFEQRQAEGKTSSRFSKESIEARMRGDHAAVTESRLPTPDEVRRAVQQAHRGHAPSDTATDMDRSLHAAIQSVETLTGATIEGFMKQYGGDGAGNAISLELAPYKPVPADELTMVSLTIDQGFYTDATAAGWDRNAIAAVSSVAGWHTDLSSLQSGDTVTYSADLSVQQTNPLQMIHSLSIEQQGEDTLSVVQYASEDGSAGFYHADTGVPLRQDVFHTLPVTGELGEDFRLSSEFGYRIHPVTGQRSHHNGIDLAAPAGTPILAAGDARVKTTAVGPNAGRYVVLEHDNGALSFYMHMNSIAPDLRVGDRIQQGDYIGDIGSTGRSTGSHLHFEYRLPTGALADGSLEYAPIDPLRALINDRPMQSGTEVVQGFDIRRSELLALHEGRQPQRVTVANSPAGPDFQQRHGKGSSLSRVFESPAAWQSLAQSEADDDANKCVDHVSRTSSPSLG